MSVFAVAFILAAGLVEPAHGQMKIGEIGDASKFRARVTQVFGRDKVLVQLLPSFENVMLKGDTKGIVDDKEYPLKEIIKSEEYFVSSTETYSTVIGSTKTVFLIEGVPDTKEAKERRERIAKLEAEARKAQATAWAEAAKARYEAELKIYEQERKDRAWRLYWSQPQADRDWNWLRRHSKTKNPYVKPELTKEQAAEDREAEAGRKLKYAKQMIADFEHAHGEERERLAGLSRQKLEELIEKYPGTKAAAEAQDILDKK
jgi:hypothetical protein